LNAETVYVNACAKFRDMNIMASRTFLVNPDDNQKQIYNLVNEALDLCIKTLVPGQPIKSAYLAARDLIKSKDPNLASKLHTNFGYGVIISATYNLIDWFLDQGRLFTDNEQNETLVRANMIFHVRITLQEIHAKVTRSVIAIGETVLINEDGSVAILTSPIQRKYSEISYSLQEDEDEKMKEENKGSASESEDSVNMGRHVNSEFIKSTRLRSKNVE
jgi:Xaa-Pro aminopeptidase